MTCERSKSARERRIALYKSNHHHHYHHHHHPVFQKFPQSCLWNGLFVRLTDDGALSSFQGKSSIASCFHTSLLQATDGVMFLALCLQVVSQASQHFSSSEKRATCEGCFTGHSICSVVSLHSGIFRAVHPKVSKVDVDHWHIPVSASHSTFCRKLVESVRRMACGVRLSLLETIQRRAWVRTHSE